MPTFISMPPPLRKNIRPTKNRTKPKFVPTFATGTRDERALKEHTPRRAGLRDQSREPRLQPTPTNRCCPPRRSESGFASSVVVVGKLAASDLYGDLRQSRESSRLRAACAPVIWRADRICEYLLNWT